MQRRDFVIGAGAGAAALLLKQQRLDALVGGSAAQLTISDVASRTVPATFTGLSYELAQLTDPTFFSARNRDLVAYFRLLSAQGVLRLGGNTSEFCWFRATPSTPAPQLHLPPANLDANWMPHQLFAIEPTAVDELGRFLDATGWRLIYGLNFGNSTPERAAVEARYVAERLGKHLEYFQIGNEPDFYKDANNGTRPPGWDFADYAHEWIRFADAIAASVPAARFGGPDVGASSDWITRFAEHIAPRVGSQLVALTGHYYAEGPPNDPRVTTARLLASDPKIPAQMQQIEAVANAHSLAYRMTEGNSCYRGGKPGMSDAFASALWAADYMLLLASLGCNGVNLHGGQARYLVAGLGGHTPGLEVSKQPQAMNSGFYTPVRSEPDTLVQAMPIFYGMLMANQFAGATLVRSDLKANANVTAYAARTSRGHQAAIFNKDDQQPVTLTIRMSGAIQRATAWRLSAPALDSLQDVTLASSTIQEHAHWSPSIESLAVRGDAIMLPVPAASGALIFMH